MGDATNPFEAIQSMMLKNLENVQNATQGYIDTVEKMMEMARRKVPKRASVLIYPFGGATYPKIPSRPS